jgi:exosortase/archaeosortase family protein
MIGMKKYLPMAKFLLITGGLVLFYYLWFVPNVWSLPILSKYYGYIVHYTLLTLGEASVFILSTIGYESWVINEAVQFRGVTDDPLFEPMRYIDMADAYMNVYIKNYCLGLNTMFVFAALIIGFPGKWKDRLWFIPLGLIGIHLINIIRIVALCLAIILSSTPEDFKHHEIFDGIAMVFIFLLFMLWVKRNTRKTENEPMVL